jgi:hypothetical protein
MPAWFLAHRQEKAVDHTGLAASVPEWPWELGWELALGWCVAEYAGYCQDYPALRPAAFPEGRIQRYKEKQYKSGISSLSILREERISCRLLH